MTEDELGELEDKLRSLGRKRMQIVIDAGELDKEINEVNEKYCELSPDYVRVECPQCANSDLKGYVINPDTNKKVKCPMCQGQAFLFMKLYEEGD